jgi:Flp pilus assembly protein TadD
MPNFRFLPPALLLTACMGTATVVRGDELSDVQRLYDSGQTAAAAQRVDQLLSASPQNPQFRFLKGVMLTEAKRNAEAIALFRKLSEDYPDLAEPFNNLAALYAAEGDYAKARTTLEQALRNNPAYATAHENLGDVYAALAAQSYTRALTLPGSSFSAPPKLSLMRALYKHPIGGASAVQTEAPLAASATASAPRP